MPSFAQIYVVGGTEEVQTRAYQSGSDLDEGILATLQQFMHENNSYAQFYRSVAPRIALRVNPPPPAGFTNL
ncbi:hypothetical protein PGTUg99_024255 [Puccinia graminis f. sp. tritici]|uniref:Uncharacterized protein n=1 Tax=Puccinia graminis f. sp. tritici TaxID=56615 RepID=A0A5B0P587_PUCGR|nr:hypothetical protein PGTUg99_024255 [Puccinia graminis f. sp. tritici]